MGIKKFLGSYDKYRFVVNYLNTEYKHQKISPPAVEYPCRGADLLKRKNRLFCSGPGLGQPVIPLGLIFSNPLRGMLLDVFC